MSTMRAVPIRASASHTKSVRCEIVNVTPEMAASWLAGRRKNRHISDAHVRFLAGQMERGEFVVSGETIIFNDRDELMDGQHRLSAIVMSGVTVSMLVVRGVPDEFFDVLGQGKSRNAADSLSIHDQKNVATLAAVARMVFRWTDTGLAAPTTRPSIGQINKIVEENPTLAEAANFASSNKELRTIMPGSAVAFCYWKIAQGSGSEAARDFMEKIAVPSGLEKGDPRFALHRNFTNRRILGGAGRGASHSADGFVALAFKAWNLWLTGKQAMIIAVKDNESFPIPVDA